MGIHHLLLPASDQKEEPIGVDREMVSTDDDNNEAVELYDGLQSDNGNDDKAEKLATSVEELEANIQTIGLYCIVFGI